MDLITFDNIVLLHDNKTSDIGLVAITRLDVPGATTGRDGCSPFRRIFGKPYDGKFGKQAHLTARTTRSDTVLFEPSLRDVLTLDLWIPGRTVRPGLRRSPQDAIQSVRGSL